MNIKPFITFLLVALSINIESIIPYFWVIQKRPVAAPAVWRGYASDLRGNGPDYILPALYINNRTYLIKVIKQSSSLSLRISATSHWCWCWLQRVIRIVSWLFCRHFLKITHPLKFFNLNYSFIINIIIIQLVVQYTRSMLYWFMGLLYNRHFRSAYSLSWLSHVRNIW